jgi:hypothetical protein
MADGQYVKVYMNDTRVGNVPNADLGRSKSITFEIPGHETEAALITNIRVMAGGRKLYDAIADSGRVGMQGIYFDTGSDRIRPESAPTLKEIGEMLKEHADLKLTIEGHTDNVGAAEANQQLSAQRAAAVKAFLVTAYGIDAARLQSKASDRTSRLRRIRHQRDGSRIDASNWSRINPRGQAAEPNVSASWPPFPFTGSEKTYNTNSFPWAPLVESHPKQFQGEPNGEAVPRITA